MLTRIIRTIGGVGSVMGFVPGCAAYRGRPWALEFHAFGVKTEEQSMCERAAKASKHRRFQGADSAGFSMECLVAVKLLKKNADL